MSGSPTFDWLCRHALGQLDTTGILNLMDDTLNASRCGLSLFAPFCRLLWHCTSGFHKNLCPALPRSTYKPPGKRRGFAGLCSRLCPAFASASLGQTLRFAAALIAVWDSCFLGLPIPLRPMPHH